MKNLKFYYDARQGKIIDSSNYNRAENCWDEHILPLNAKTREEAENEVKKQDMPSMERPYFIYVGYACGDIKSFSSLAAAEEAGEKIMKFPYPANLVSCICNLEDAPDRQ